MKEVWRYLINFDLKNLFFTPTENGILQFVRYGFVGGVATIIDWGILFVLTQCGMHYMVSAVVSFLAGLIVNFILSKMFVFRASEARVNSTIEFLMYGLIGGIGLGLTMGIMWLFTEVCKMYYMGSKVIATLLVLGWNYFARKLFLYKERTAR